MSSHMSKIGAQARQMMIMLHPSGTMQKQAVPLDEILYLCSNASDEQIFTKYNSKMERIKNTKTKTPLLPIVPVGQEREDA